MLLQTNSYVVPKEKRVEHARLVRRFKQALARLGCDKFEVYEQVGTNWSSDQTSGRFVQILRFHDRREQLAVQAAERNDPSCQAIIAEFCELINYPYQQQQGLFAIGYYSCLLGQTKALPQGTGVAEAPSQPIPAEALPAAEVVETAPPVAEEIQFGETPVRPPAEHEPVAPAAVDDAISSDLYSDATADQSIAGQPAGANGDTIHEEVSPTESEATSLDELIKKRFGSLEITSPADEITPAEPTTDSSKPGENGNGEHSSPPPAGSGIGEVLNAIGDDDDYDFLLPGEPIDASAAHPQGGDAQKSEPDSRRD